MERNLCIIPKVFAFKVPPAQSSGYRASDWSKEPIWSGRLRVLQVGDAVSIQLQHVGKEGLFGNCPVTDPRCVEPVTDSSRYFVLRLDDGHGRHAFVGIGFNSRDEAFEFKVALQDSDNRAQSQKRAEEYLDSLPAQDFSLPEDGMIRVNVNLKTKKGASASAPRPAHAAAAPAAASASDPFALPPPPKKAAAAAGATTSAAPSAVRPPPPSKPPQGKAHRGQAPKSQEEVVDVLGLSETFGAVALAPSTSFPEDELFTEAPAPKKGGAAAPAASKPAVASKPAPAPAAKEDDWVAFD